LATRAAIYGRVSTSGQSTELQLEALRAYAAARGLTVAEFCDHNVSGAKEKRPALNALVAAPEPTRSTLWWRCGSIDLRDRRGTY